MLLSNDDIHTHKYLNTCETYIVNKSREREIKLKIIIKRQDSWNIVSKQKEVAKMTEIRFFEFLHKLKMNLRKERGGNRLKGQNFNKDISKLFKDILPFTVLYFKQISLAIRKLFICFIQYSFWTQNAL